MSIVQMPRDEETHSVFVRPAFASRRYEVLANELVGVCETEAEAVALAFRALAEVDAAPFCGSVYIECDEASADYSCGAAFYRRATDIVVSK